LSYEEVPSVVGRADTRLQDPLVLDEIEMYGELVIAASSSERPLSRDEIDHVLGLDEVGD
jgi:hypothetical protein